MAAAQERLGKYLIHEELGRGGFGTVYRATDTTLNSDVALKVLHPVLLADPGFLHRFEEEARAIRKLEHPNIVTLYELGAAEGRHYLAMQLMRGGSLADRIRSRGSIPLADTARIIEEIAAALDHAHGEGYAHRDIKPSNILFDATGRAVLADFGLARAVDASLSSGGSSIGHGIAGTAPYVAPEIWDGKAAGPATDIYALGCVAYEMLTGQPMFEGATTSAAMHAHFQPRRYPPDWPAEWRACFDRALAVEPAQRFATAGAFAAGLRNLAVAEVASGSSQRSRRWPALVALVTGISSIIIVSAILLRQCGFPPPPPTATPEITSTSTATMTQTQTPVPPTVTATAPPSPTPEPSPTELVAETSEQAVISAANIAALQVRTTLEGHQDWLRAVTFSPDGAQLASCAMDGTVRLWDPASGALLHELRGHTDTVWSLAYAPDASSLASGSEDRTVRIWRADDGTEIASLPTLTNGVLDVAYSPDGEKLFVGTYDGELQLWDIQAQLWVREFSGDRGAVFTIAVSPDGETLASGSADNMVRLWDLATGELRAELTGHTGWVRDVVFSPDGTLLASTGADQTIILWRIADRSLLMRLQGHTNRIAALAFTPDGQLLASASYDGTVRFWRPADGMAVGVLRAHREGITAIAFSPDQTTLATGSPDRTIQLWQP